MLAKRIIPCLDIKDGRTVKGINFENLRDAGDAVSLAEWYCTEGADELVFLDITATHEGRNTFTDLVTRIAERINIPFTVGGGISTLTDVARLLNAGADKVSINSAAVRNPDLINQIADAYGAQCIVLAIDARETNNDWKVFLSGGRTETEWNLFDWATEGTRRGAGEILFTSMNHDGTKSGFANAALKKLTSELPIPVIASGGGGNAQHFVDVFNEANVEAALAASIFHFKEVRIKDLKHYLREKNINVRL